MGAVRGLVVLGFLEGGGGYRGWCLKRVESWKCIGRKRVGKEEDVKVKIVKRWLP